MGAASGIPFSCGFLVIFFGLGIVLSFDVVISLTLCETPKELCKW